MPVQCSQLFLRAIVQNDHPVLAQPGMMGRVLKPLEAGQRTAHQHQAGRPRRRARLAGGAPAIDQEIMPLALAHAGHIQRIGRGDACGRFMRRRRVRQVGHTGQNAPNRAVQPVRGRERPDLVLRLLGNGQHRV